MVTGRILLVEQEGKWICIVLGLRASPESEHLLSVVREVASKVLSHSVLIPQSRERHGIWNSYLLQHISGGTVRLEFAIILDILAGICIRFFTLLFDY